MVCYNNKDLVFKLRKNQNKIYSKNINKINVFILKTYNKLVIILWCWQ